MKDRFVKILLKICFVFADIYTLCGKKINVQKMKSYIYNHTYKQTNSLIVLLGRYLLSLVVVGIVGWYSRQTHSLSGQMCITIRPYGLKNFR